jgi:hypothetical protein
VPRVEAEWTAADRWGTAKVRWGVGRMDYRVVPGLYALAEPNARSPVLVTANYKMSFDRLRRACAGLDAWILVLDTDGINVWCAAGKGSFGNEELAHRIADTKLDTVVEHRRLILPQLGAPGVAGHLIERRMGFEVIWGPVMAEDLPAFLAAGRRATAEMRRKRFPLGERLAIIPVELVAAVKVLVPVMAAVFLLGGLGDPRGYWAGALEHGLTGVSALLSGLIAGTVVTPLLLPWLPGRAFAIKGAVAGVAVVAIALLGRVTKLAVGEGVLEVAAWLLIGGALAAFLAMNFTGASTYTSLSGVRKEMRYAVPLQIVAAVIGLGLWIGSLWLPGVGG